MVVVEDERDLKMDNELIGLKNKIKNKLLKVILWYSFLLFVKVMYLFLNFENFYFYIKGYKIYCMI